MTNSDLLPHSNSPSHPNHTGQNTTLNEGDSAETVGGDDFDDFEEGGDDDFGDFDDGFQEPDANLDEPDPASLQPSQKTTPPFVVSLPQ